ncbi:MAG TPA: M56 family metallopeptidase [Candidatus Angelobacter sp.]|jgi:beta-lactamase regulating signal transducer with metallopeptidase domain|nr:M56 family metallopeptidase [Candidatus Angelobacter sp.]
MNALHAIAPAVVEAMMYCLIEGTLLALFVYLALRIVSRKNSGTRFAIWFATLVAVILAPVVTLPSLKAVSVAGSASLTLPASLAVWAFLAWAAIATAGLLRVAVGFWQVLRLRKTCVSINLADLSPEVRKIVEQAQESRPVLIGTSPKLDVPTAIGFRKPAVLLPAWLVAEVSPTELKHVLLHELAHLRRRDDWTNLVQKLVKALLFFHPLVWWIENRLSLERELACDDAVLAKTESPRIYAQCLARMAEKSLLRRQIALAQAAVSRMHLSNRVMQILDGQRPRTTQLWKPAIPLVAVFAITCAVSLRQAPALVSFTEGQATPVATASKSVSLVIPSTSVGSTGYQQANPQGMGAQFITAGFKLPKNQEHSVSQRLIPHRAVKHALQSNPIERVRKMPPASMFLASYSGYVVAHEELVVTMTSQDVRGQCRVQIWQLRVIIPADKTEKPTPRKT